MEPSSAQQCLVAYIVYASVLHGQVVKNIAKYNIIDVKSLQSCGPAFLAIPLNHKLDIPTLRTRFASVFPTTDALIPSTMSDTR